MGLFISTAIIILAVVLSNIVAQFFPKISNTYFNLFLGIVFGFIPFTNELVLPFHSEIFMILILAPVLFFEGQNTPMLLVKQKIKSIFGTAVILAVISAVLSTIIIPSIFEITFPLALLVVALSTPTDATAFDSVIGGRIVDEKVETTLKLESLFNDATGIVLMTSGIGWLATGKFSLEANALFFLRSAIGGVFVGGVLALLLMFLRQILVRSSINLISAQTTIYLATPFIIYYLSEKIEVSGIIAVVVAGIVYNSEASRSSFSNPKQAYFRFQIVEFINEMLNSSIFVILGLSLSRIIIDPQKTNIHSLDWLYIGVFIYIASTLLRFLYAYFVKFKHNYKDSLVFSLGGVHGTVTLALVFSIISQVDGKLFYYILLIESVVIILSMIIPSVVFKYILPIDSEEINKEKHLSELRNELVKIGLKQIRTLNLPSKILYLVEYDLNEQMNNNGTVSFLMQWSELNSSKHVMNNLQSMERRRALMSAFTAERNYLYELSLKKTVSRKIIYTLYSEILLAESLIMDPQLQSNL